MALRYASYAFFSRHAADRPHPEQERIAEHLQRRHPELRSCDASQADLLLVFGGDGTLLEAVRSRGQRRQHLIAFNTGHKGFLTTVREPERFVEALDRALEGELARSPMPVMRVVHRQAGVDTVLHAVNDVLIDCAMTWLGLRLESAARHGTTFIKNIRGSGVCVCSAVGSTLPMAVHLNAPRIDHRIRALYVKGINDASPPAAGLLLSAERRAMRIILIRIEPNLGIPEKHRHPPALFLDGIRASDVAVGDTIEITYDTRPSVLLRMPEETHWDRVRALRT